MMPSLVKRDDVRKWKKSRGSSWPVTAGTGVNGLNNGENTGRIFFGVILVLYSRKSIFVIRGENY